MFLKQYFPLMEVEQHDWATRELVRNAEASVGELEESLRREGYLTLFLIPLADFESSGAYRIGPKTLGFIIYADGSMEWHFPPPGDDAFAEFERECRSACDTLHAYLTRLLTYALAHGMDVAKANETGQGRSIFRSLPHSDLHTDTEEYDS